MSATTVCSPSRAAHAACRAATSRWSGTTSRAPRPAAAVAAAASASRSAHDSPGRACHTACAARPPASASSSAGPRGYRPQPVAGSAGGSRARLRVAAGLGRRLGLHPGVPRRHREPQDVRQHPGIPVGHRAAQGRDLARQHRLGRHHLVHPGQLPRVVGVPDPLQQEAVDQPAGEPHPHPHPGHRHVVEVGGHPVVEGPVQVGEGDVDRDPGDRQGRRRAPLPPRPGRSRHRSSSAGRCGPAASCPRRPRPPAAPHHDRRERHPMVIPPATGQRPRGSERWRATPGSPGRGGRRRPPAPPR